MAVRNDVRWRTFAAGVGLSAADTRFATNTARVQHREELVYQIEGALSAARVQTWLDRLHPAGVPSGKVRGLADVYDWAQTPRQGPAGRRRSPHRRSLAAPWATPAARAPERTPRGSNLARSAPPLLGEHDEAVRAWLEVKTP